MSRSLVIANWKMHGSLEFNQNLLEDLSDALPALENTQVAVCPPALYLSQVWVELDASGLEDRVLLGAQNVCAESSVEGAYTGETSAAMLADVAVAYALVGHSERREYYSESNEVLAKKFICLQEKGIKPVFCIGENLEQREAGNALAVIEAQLKAVVDVVGIQAFANAVVAYEPIWAIGTGKTATPEQAQEVHAFIRAWFAGLNAELAAGLSLLYGGSVKPGNAKTLFAQEDIDGALVGGASLNAADFSAICEAADASV